jgi:predicted CXXCH cytochrome family protein
MARSKQGSGKKGGPRKPVAAPQIIDKPGAPPQDAERGRVWRRTLPITVSVAAVVAGGLAFWLLTGGPRIAFFGSAPPVAAAIFVGSETCAGCHRAEAERWRGSQHERAMQHATEKSVLGDFNDASFDYFGVHSRFFRKDGKFLVETDGPDGKLAAFEVMYTFGVDPLQQYLVELPDGRVQALSLAWDSRPKDAGGQRWFHLYPNEQIKHDDVLHWTKLNQNWNFMCAECHSTGVRKNYNAATDRFATTWAEISVGCEACHGQGSRHVVWAQAQQSWWPFGRSEDPKMGLAVRFDERRDITWRADPKTGNPARNFPPALLRKEVETCGLCHARRGEFSEAWVPGPWLSDTHVVSPLVRGLYHADGQMLDEVYNYGSFKQSRMFAAGVTCSDCHEPHGAKLRAPGDGVCLGCHASDKYASATHHHHPLPNPPPASVPSRASSTRYAGEGREAAPPSCASCHMPARTYMVVDRRHDHSFRIPRPDLSVKLGTPNACNDCHTDKPAEWAASAIEGWYGLNRKGFQKYAEAFHSAWTEKADATALLAAVVSDGNAPAFVRASALTALGSRVSPSTINLARTALSDPDPMVRIGALDMLESLPGGQLWPLVSPLLSDSNRGVRIRAASLLATVPSANQPPADREPFERAAAELVAAQRLNADRPEARSTLGHFLARRGRPVEAEAEYQAALRLSPQYSPAAINLADLYRQLGRDADGASVLQAAIAASPADGGLHHALGLTLTRLKQPEAALAEIRRAVELEPDRARYAYVYAVALHSAGRGDEAISALKEGLARHPDDRDILLALATFSRDAGDIAAALDYAERLTRASPNDRDLASFIEDLRRRLKAPDAR